MRCFTTAVGAVALAGCGAGAPASDAGDTDPPVDDPFGGEDAAPVTLRVVVDGTELSAPVAVTVDGRAATVAPGDTLVMDRDRLADATFIAGDPDVRTDDGRPLLFTDVDATTVLDPGASTPDARLAWFTVPDQRFTFLDDNVVTIAVIPYFKATGMKCDVTVGSTTIPYNIGNIEVKPDGSFVLEGAISDKSQWLADSGGIDLSFVSSVIRDVTEFNLGVKSLDFTYSMQNSPADRVVNCDWQ